MRFECRCQRAEIRSVITATIMPFVKNFCSLMNSVKVPPEMYSSTEKMLLSSRQYSMNFTTLEWFSNLLMLISWMRLFLKFSDCYLYFIDLTANSLLSLIRKQRSTEPVAPLPSFLTCLYYLLMPFNPIFPLSQFQKRTANQSCPSRTQNLYQRSSCSFRNTSFSIFPCFIVFSMEIKKLNFRLRMSQSWMLTRQSGKTCNLTMDSGSAGLMKKAPRRTGFSAGILQGQKSIQSISVLSHKNKSLGLFGLLSGVLIDDGPQVFVGQVQVRLQHTPLLLAFVDVGLQLLDQSIKFNDSIFIFLQREDGVCISCPNLVEFQSKLIDLLGHLVSTESVPLDCVFRLAEVCLCFAYVVDVQVVLALKAVQASLSQANILVQFVDRILQLLLVVQLVLAGLAEIRKFVGALIEFRESALFEQLICFVKGLWHLRVALVGLGVSPLVVNLVRIKPFLPQCRGWSYRCIWLGRGRTLEQSDNCGLWRCAGRGEGWGLCCCAGCCCLSQILFKQRLLV